MNNTLKYIIRAIKYFFYYIIMLAVVLTILVLFNFAEGDINSIFRNGYDSLKQIAIMFAGVAAIYPIFGFITKDAHIPGEFNEIRDSLVKAMEDRGYRLTKEEGENLSFKLRSVVSRISRMWEDTIEFERIADGFCVKGIRKDVVRIVSALEYKLRQDNE